MFLGKLGNDGKHWYDELLLESRAFFRVENKFGSLVLENVKKKDNGTYTCRVDFQTAPTKITNIHLGVIIRPERPQIYDEIGRVVKNKIGPFKVEDTVTLMCLVTTGDPKPEVTWWKDHILVDATFKNDTSRVENEIVIGPLKKRDWNAVYTCQANNNNISVPQSTSVKLDMTCNI